MDPAVIAQTHDMLYALRNPAGVPVWPLLFVVLGIITFALHIFFVQLMLGSGLVSLYGAFRKDANWQRLAKIMLDIMKVTISVAIVIGVAPLLFVQVYYDPNWYTSNVLSANYVIAFIVILMIAYWAVYFFYFKNYGNDGSKPLGSIWSLVFGYVLLLFVGWIMHGLTVQTIHPELWRSWYAPDGVVDYSGSSIHAWNLWRYMFWVSMGIPAAGAMMIAYRRFKSVRADYDQDYLNWIYQIGKKWMTLGALVPLVFYVGWMFTVPETAGNWVFSWGILGLAGVVAIPLWSMVRLANDNPFCQYMALPVTFVAVLLAAVAREMLRFNVMATFDYSFMDYKINFDWYSTGLFLVTFLVVGGVTLSYMFTVAWKTGQSKDVYVASPAIEKWGTVSYWLIIAWLVEFFAVGFWVWAR
ncbi:MAG: hypothetical protein ACWA44_09890 [Thiotrichales bacterium]